MTNPIVDLDNTTLAQDFIGRQIISTNSPRYVAPLFPNGVNLTDADGDNFTIVRLSIPLSSVEPLDWITVGAPTGSNYLSFVSAGGVPLGDLELYGSSYAPVSFVAGSYYVTSSSMNGSNIVINVYRYDPQLGQVTSTPQQMEAVLNSLYFVGQNPNRLGGEFRVTVAATDTNGETDTSVLTTFLFNPITESPPEITSLGGNDTANITVLPGATFVVDNIATDVDPGDVKTWSIEGGANAGLFTINSISGKLAFINPAIVGTYEVDVAVTDFVGKLDYQTIIVKVAAPNTPPDARDEEFTLERNGILEITTLFDNDTDIEDGQLTFTDNYSSIAIQPLHGQLDIDSNSGRFTYTPTAGYIGPDRFTYEVVDSNGMTDTAKVTLTVLAPPPPTGVIAFSSEAGGLKFDFDGSGDSIGDSAAALVNVRIGESINYFGQPLRVVGQGVELFFPTIADGTGVDADNVGRIIGTKGQDSFAVIVDQSMTIEGGNEPDPFGDSGGDSFYITGDGVTVLGQGGDDRFAIFGSGGKVDGGSGDYDKIDLQPLSGTGKIIYTIQRFDDGTGQLSPDAEGFFQATFKHDDVTDQYLVKNVEQFQFVSFDPSDTATIDIDMPGTGTVRVYATAGNDTIRVNADNVEHTASAGVNTITLCGGASYVNLWDGSNILDPGEDSGQFGAVDWDFVSWALISSDPAFNIRRVNFDLAIRDANGFAEVNVVNPDGSTRIDRIKNVEELLGSGGDDTMLGDDAMLPDGGANVVWGLLGNDSIAGRGGNDTLEGDEGNDQIAGGSGDDFLRGGAQFITFSPPFQTGSLTDDDRLTGGTGNDTIYGGSETNSLGAADTDTAVYSGNRNDYAITSASDAGYGNNGFRIEDLRDNGAANDGVDFVYQVERFEFADGTYSVAQLLSC